MIDYIDIAVPAALEETDHEVKAATLLPWPDSQVRAPPSERWRQEKPPSELEDVIAIDGHPSELLDIIRWSLQKQPSRGVLSTATSPVSRRSRQSGVDDAVATPPTSPDSLASCVQLAKPISASMRNDCIDVDTTPDPPFSPGNGKGTPASVFARLVSRVLPSAFSDADSKHDADQDGSMRRTPTLPKQPTMTECTSCFDEIPRKEATKLSCTHSYCKLCFTTLVMTAIQTETAFPPRCCLTKVPLKTIIAPLTKEEKELYQQKAAEYATEPKNRWYCHQAKCGKWIPSSKLYDCRTIRTQKCPYCASEQCLICRGDAHPANTECPQDFGLEATLREAETRGYKRCFRCSTLVELTGGCRHMTCTCGAEFCYVCGKKWQTCGCTIGDHTRQQAGIRRRREVREQQDIAGRAEEEEIARAIAQVETLIEQDRVDAERREAERMYAEELELARLESLRLEELEQRRKEEEEMEQQRTEMLSTSIGERLVFLQEELQALIHYQQSALVSRHESEVHVVDEKHDDEKAVCRMETESVHVILTANMERRQQMLGEKHAIELSELTAQHQDEEDDIRTWAHLQYKDKPNGESREQRQVDNIVKEQLEARQKVEKRHQDDFTTLQQNFDVEMRGLEKSRVFRDESADEEYQRERDRLGSLSDADQRWTVFILDRRNRLLHQHGRLLQHELAVGVDPVGLTEEKAWQVMPPWPQPAPPESTLQRFSQARPVSHEVYELPSTSTAGSTSRLVPAPLRIETQGESRSVQNEILQPPQRYYESHHLLDEPSRRPSQPYSLFPPAISSRRSNRPQQTHISTPSPSSSSATITKPTSMPMPEEAPHSSSSTSSWISLPTPPTPTIIDRMTRLADPHNRYAEPHPGTPWSPSRVSGIWSGPSEPEGVKGKARAEEEAGAGAEVEVVQEDRRGSHDRIKALHWRLRMRGRERLI